MPWLATEQPVLPEEDIVSFSLNHCDYDPDQPVYHDLENESRTISWRQANEIVRKLVAGFRKAGLRKGDCFSVTAFNDIMYSMLFLAGIGAGGIFSGMNPAYRMAEIRHHIRTAEVKFFICEPDFLEPLLEVLESENPPNWREKLFVFDILPNQSVPSGLRSWRWLMEHGSSEWDVITDVPTLQETEVSRLTTSGTTGPPKFASQSHRNGTSYHELFNRGRNFTWETRVVSVMPSFHVATVPAVHVSPLRSGWKIWIMRRFDLEIYLAAVQKYQITEMGVPPPLVVAIINSPLTKKYSLRSVHRIVAGAAPLDAESQNRFQRLCAEDSKFTQVWGMTETTSSMTVFRWPDEDYTGSVGNRVLEGTDVKLIDDNGKDITAYNVRGEMCVRGPTVVKGYFKNDKANAESWDSEGYFKTGDILYCDGKTKKWYVVDRKKELIKVRGFQVAPPELEGVLLSHPEITDAAVLAVPGKTKGEEQPRAYVVRKAGSKVTEEDVRQYMSNNLAKYKELTGGVIFIDEIPKSPSGKILKRIIREWIAKEGKEKAKL